MGSLPRYFGRMAISAVIPLEWNSVRIIDYLRKTTGTYRNTDMLKDIREARDIFQFGPKVHALAVNVRPPRSIMVEVELKRARRYKLIGEQRKVNIATGGVSYEPISFYSNSLRTKEQWGKECVAQEKKVGSDKLVEVTNVEIFTIQHHKGWKY